LLREIRGVDQKTPGRTKRWFQDDYFDLIAWHDANGTILRFQLCTARETRAERVLEWRRGLGFQQLRTEDRASFKAGRDDDWALHLDRHFAPGPLRRRFLAAAADMPELLREFVEQKIEEFARPRRYQRAGAFTPHWIERLRERQREALRRGVSESSDQETAE
jgi:hypothetical protein